MILADITLKPSTLKGWFIVGTTKKCYKIAKTMDYKYDRGEHVTYIPKKYVLSIKELRG